MKVKPCEQEYELGRYKLEFNKKGNEKTQKLLKLKSQMEAEEFRLRTKNFV